MAKKKTSAVVFAGNNENAPVFQQEQKESPPPYEDTGVKFQGYSKYSIGNGKFGLKYQQKFYSYITISNSTTPQSFQIVGQNKAFVTDLIIAFVDTGGIATTTTRRFILGRMEGIGGAFTEVMTIPLFKPVNTAAGQTGTSGNTVVLHFNTPIQVDGITEISVLAGKFSENGTEVKASICGYIEA